MEEQMELLPSVQKVEKHKGSFRFAGKSFACETSPHCIAVYNKESDLDGILTDYRGKPEGYTLDITSKNINIRAGDYAGLYYGIQTLNQLKDDFDRIPCMKITDYPDIRMRGVHLDLKGNLPKFERMKRIIENLGTFKFNTILLEYEDKFPFKSHPGIVSPLALTRAEIEELVTVAEYNAIKIIPLVQCAGHVEYILKHPKYSGLMEDKRFLNEFCLTDKRAQALYRELAFEVMSAHKTSEYFHVGGDEAWNRGSCPRCKKESASKGKDKFYIDYISGVCDFVKSNGMTPIVWDDCFRKAAPAELKKIAGKAVLMYWKYGTTTARQEEEQYPDLKLYKKAGIRLAGASAAAGADGFTASVAKNIARMENNLSWAVTAKKHGMEGVVGTAWTRYCGMWPPAAAFEVSWMPVVGLSEFLWKTPKTNELSGFNRRFVKRFYGIEAEDISRAHYLVERDNQKAFEAREIFKKFKGKVTKNADIVELMEVSCEITEQKEYLKWVLELTMDCDWYRNKYYVLWKQEKKDKIAECLKALKSINGVMKRTEEVYSKFLKAPEAREFALSRFALEKYKIEEYLKMFKKTKPA